MNTLVLITVRLIGGKPAWERYNYQAQKTDSGYVYTDPRDGKKRNVSFQFLDQIRVNIRDAANFDISYYTLDSGYNSGVRIQSRLLQKAREIMDRSITSLVNSDKEFHKQLQACEQILKS